MVLQLLLQILGFSLHLFHIRLPPVQSISAVKALGFWFALGHCYASQDLCAVPQGPSVATTARPERQVIFSNQHRQQADQKRFFRKQTAAYVFYATTTAFYATSTAFYATGFLSISRRNACQARTAVQASNEPQPSKRKGPLRRQVAAPIGLQKSKNLMHFRISPHIFKHARSDLCRLQLAGILGQGQALVFGSKAHANPLDHGLSMMRGGDCSLQLLENPGILGPKSRRVAPYMLKSCMSIRGSA